MRNLERVENLGLRYRGGRDSFFLWGEFQFAWPKKLYKLQLNNKTFLTDIYKVF